MWVRSVLCGDLGHLLPKPTDKQVNSRFSLKYIPSRKYPKNPSRCDFQQHRASRPNRCARAILFHTCRGRCPIVARCGQKNRIPAFLLYISSDMMLNLIKKIYLLFSSKQFHQCALSAYACKHRYPDPILSACNLLNRWPKSFALRYTGNSL